MKCIFCSMIYSDIDNDISITKNPKPVSGHKFQCNLIKGLTENGVDLEVYNTQRISTYPKNKKIIVNEQSIEILNGKGIDIKYINIPFINYITQQKSLKIKLQEAIERCNDKKIILLVFNTYYIQSKTIFSLKKKYPHIVTCNVVGDLYGKFGLKTHGRGLKKAWQRYVEKKQESLQDAFDKYVLLSPAMQQVLNLKDDDFVVVEGFYNKDNAGKKEIVDDSIVIDKEHKIVFYAGSIKLEYGIEHLLKAFDLIKYDNYHLYIAGSGDGEELVKKYSTTNHRIKFLGFLSPHEVARYQGAATVLVSPRKSDKAFVKYSFPSKTFECLASRKPYIAHKLPCEPLEYSNYIQYPADETDEALCNKIIQVCEMSSKERKAIADAAYNFITSEKNTKVMCEKIVNLFNSCFKET